eukprot:scaffold156994_cov17-Tisochrysis_lutea.AAC.3
MITHLSWTCAASAIQAKRDDAQIIIFMRAGHDRLTHLQACHDRLALHDGRAHAQALAGLHGNGKLVACHHLHCHTHGLQANSARAGWCHSD